MRFLIGLGAIVAALAQSQLWVHLFPLYAALPLSFIGGAVCGWASVELADRYAR